MISSSLLSRPRLTPRPVPAAASPCGARLAVGGARGLAAGVRCQAGDMDSHYMRRCVELARTAAGHTSPNPMVGCVIVREGQVVGEGFHPKAGQPHAEVFALRDAGDLAENATAYVSLEPCNHYGRTPPCTEALIKAKVKEVVVGMTDPNPVVASKGIEKLRNAGIDVRVGVEEALCLRLNEAYIHRMLTGKAFATLRTTLSMNGIVINQIGSGADQAGGYYSQLVKEYDGVIISSDMAKATALPISCEAGAKQPLYIIIAQGDGSKLHIPFLDEESASNAIVLADSPVTMEPSGVGVSVLDQMNLESILQLLADRGLCSVLVDFRDDGAGLASLLKNFQEDKLVQKVVVELSPVWMVSPGLSDLAFGGSQSFALKNVEHKEPCSCTPPSGTRAGSTREGGPARTTAATRPTSAATEMSGCPSLRYQRKMKNVRMMRTPEMRLMLPLPPAVLRWRRRGGCRSWRRLDLGTVPSAIRATSHVE